MLVRLAALILLIAPGFSQAQGFDGYGTPDGFRLPDPDTRLSFPADHGPHDGFRVEWWYVTANLTGPDGTDYGVQWTLFRNALSPEAAEGWASPVVWMAHAALTTPDHHFAAERFARGGIGQAGVFADPFEAWIDDWSMAGSGLSNLNIAAQDADFSYDLTLQATGHIVTHGAQSYSVKSREGHASHYYSQPFFEVDGRIRVEDETIPVTGTAWLDREWSSQLLGESQTGWDWVGLSFDDGARLMGFRLRSENGAAPTRGTWIGPDGVASDLPPGSLIMEPLETSETDGGAVPTSWRIRLDERSVNIVIEAINPQSWMDLAVAYWEGPVRIGGTHEGRGYLEMTGYE